MADVLAGDELATLRRLRARLDRELQGEPRERERQYRSLGLRNLDAYYDGQQRLEQIGLAVPEELKDFVTIVAWPGTYVDAIADRCFVEGFRLPGETDADDNLWELWQSNNLDSESEMARIDRMVFKRSYYCVGSDGPAGRALITVESPLQMVHEWSNRDRKVTAAARFYVDDSTGRKIRHATLYLPDSTVWVQAQGRGWEIIDRDDHGLGVVLVVPSVNRPRTHNRYGVTQMLRMISITDAAARALTNAGVGTEIAALPQRWAAGMTQADFKDPVTDEALTAWEAYFGSVWATANEKAKFGQFQAGDLGNFSKIVGHYAQLASGTTGLPMRYFGQLSDNPPSAEGIRADESRLIGACESQNTSEAGDLELVISLARYVETGEVQANLRMLETIYRNAGTPTEAQTTDAAVKAHAQGLISRREALRQMRKTKTQIDNIERELAEEALDPITRALAAQIADEEVPPVSA